MENNKVILTYCPNYKKIINTDFLEYDHLSLKLVEIYRDFIFKIDLNNTLDIAKAKDLDQTMGKYVDDYSFRKTMQQEIVNIKLKKSATDILRAIVDIIIGIFKKYEEDATRKIYLSRWI